jgi:hypothetical protein
MGGETVQWGIVDLFGHSRTAGRISEHELGGETFVRVDAPNNPEDPDAYATALYGKGITYLSPLGKSAC